MKLLDFAGKIGTYVVALLRLVIHTGEKYPIHSLSDLFDFTFFFF